MKPAREDRPTFTVSSRARLAAFAVLAVLASLFALYRLQWGGFGYASYCGTVNETLKNAAHEAMGAVTDSELPNIAVESRELSALRGDCVLSCSSDDPTAPAPNSALAVLRRCKTEVRAQKCSLDLDLVGERLDSSLVLSDVVVKNLRIQRSELRGLMCRGCSFKSANDDDAFLVRDSVLTGSLVLRSGGIPNLIAQARFVEPAQYGDDRELCAPRMTLAKNDDVELPIVMERSRVGGALDLELLKFKRPVSLTNCSVGGVLLFDRAKFSDWSSFHGTTARTISAAGAQFLGDARLFRMSAEGDAWFECAEFRSTLNMTGFTAGGILNLNRATFAPAKGPASDTKNAIALDSLRARGLDLTAALSTTRVSFADTSLEWLSLVNLTSARPLVFDGGKVGRIVIYSPSWFAAHQKYGGDLTRTGDYPGYWTDGLESVSVGSIDPDEAGEPNKTIPEEVRFSHVLQFLRNSDHSLRTYDVAAREYHENGKYLWESHLAFCSAAQKTNPLLAIGGRLRHFSPEVPILAALLLLVGQVIWLRRVGIRAVGGDFLKDARALVEGALAETDELEMSVLRQRVLRTPTTELPPPPETRYADLTSELDPVEHSLALALLTLEWKHAVDKGPDTQRALHEELARIERYFDASVTRDAWEIARFAVASSIQFFDIGPARAWELAEPKRSGVLTVIRGLWSILIAWAASIIFAYLT